MTSTTHRATKDVPGHYCLYNPMKVDLNNKHDQKMLLKGYSDRLRCMVCGKEKWFKLSQKVTINKEKLSYYEDE